MINQLFVFCVNEASNCSRLMYENCALERERDKIDSKVFIDFSPSVYCFDIVKLCNLIMALEGLYLRVKVLITS